MPYRSQVRGLAFGLQGRLETLPQPVRVKDALAAAEAAQEAVYGNSPGSALGFEGHLLHRGYPVGTQPTGYLYPSRHPERVAIASKYVTDARRSAGL